MSGRAIWKGVLKISLVTIPIKVFPATDSSDGLSFNQLHESCRSRMQQKRWCPTCEKEVPSTEIVKGFEFEKGKYVILLDAEVDAVKPDSARVIDLVQFAQTQALEPMFIDRTYYLAPDGPDDGPAAHAYALLCQAMVGDVGIGKLAIYGREYLVAVSPLRGVLLLYTLHHAAEMRTPPYLAVRNGEVHPEAGTAELKLARSVIAALTQPLDLVTFTDQYQVDLRTLIDAKIAGQEIVQPTPVDTPPTLQLRNALTLSLAAMAATKKKPAKVATTKRKRAS